MKQAEFISAARKHFGEFLSPLGFSYEKSRHSTFHRRASDDVFHFIIPSLSRDGTWFDVKVFAQSPLIQPQFSDLFPDDLGIPSQLASNLHPDRGVGVHHKAYRCNKIDGFIRNFDNEVVPALKIHALPYLDKLKTLQDLLPIINDDFYMGVCLWRLGRQSEARDLLVPEALRLAGLSDQTDYVKTLTAYISDLIGFSATETGTHRNGDTHSLSIID